VLQNRSIFEHCCRLELLVTVPPTPIVFLRAAITSWRCHDDCAPLLLLCCAAASGDQPAFSGLQGLVHSRDSEGDGVWTKSKQPVLVLLCIVMQAGWMKGFWTSFDCWGRYSPCCLLQHPICWPAWGLITSRLGSIAFLTVPPSAHFWTDCIKCYLPALPLARSLDMDVHASQCCFNACVTSLGCCPTALVQGIQLCCLLLPVVFYCFAHCEQLCYMADRDTKVMM
jgi:hypothetical protein